MGIVPPLGEANPLYGVTSRRPKGRGGDGWEQIQHQLSVQPVKPVIHNFEAYL